MENSDWAGNVNPCPRGPNGPEAPQARKPPKPPRATGCTGKFPTGDGISLGLDWLDGAACQSHGFRSFYYSSQVPAAAAPSPSQKPAGPARCTLRCTVHTSVAAWRMTHDVKGRTRCARHRKLLLSPASPSIVCSGALVIPGQSRR